MYKNKNQNGNVVFLVLMAIVSASLVLGFLVLLNSKSVDSNLTEYKSEEIVALPTQSIDLTKLPLGDNKYSTSNAKKGYIYSCAKIGGGGGAFKDGEWIDLKNSTWSKKDKKVFVDGSVEWPNAKFETIVKNSSRELFGNGVPTNHGTGQFPIDRADDAYSYDRNPNTIKTQSVLKTVSLNPTFSDKPRCLNMGAVGYSLNGVAIFNALDGEGRDAAAHEILDKCGGHPERTGEYHYHDYSECISEKSTEPKLVGYMLDGFGLYKYPINPSNDDLDECHGKTSEVFWNSKKQNIYHYVITSEYPYTIGCFRGK